MVWKQIPPGSTGSASKFGGDDTNKINAYFSGTDVDDADINSDTTFRNAKFKLRNPANTFSQTINAPAITADKTLTLPDSAWTLQSSPALVYKKYQVYQTGGTTYIIDLHGKNIASNTDTQLAVQAVLDTMGNGDVREFVWDAEPFTLNNPILLPNITAAGNIKKVIFTGTGYNATRNIINGKATLLQPSSSFPNQRCLIECQNSGDVTPKTSQFWLDGFQFYNGLAQGTKDVGAILLEAGDVGNFHFPWRVTNAHFQYMWRGLDIRGQVWYGMFENLSFNISSTGWIGDSCIRLTTGGHSTANGATPKKLVFNNVYCSHGNGLYNNFLDIRASGYNIFNNFWIDGKYYDNAAINLNNTDYPDGSIADNTFTHIATLDLDTPSPDNTKGGIYMHAGSGRVYDNRFIDCRLSNYSTYAVTMDDSGVYRNEIEMVATWGVTAALYDTGAGESNTVIVRPGAKITAGEVGISITGGTSRIIDMRRAANNGGTSSKSGDGSTKVFNIAHGLHSAPAKFRVIANSDEARGSYKVTSDGTNVIVTYPIAPPSGNNNLSFVWSAEVYN
jgi:hypothetical protein